MAISALSKLDLLLLESATVRRRVELRRRDAGEHLDLLLLVPLRRPEQRVLARLLALEVALRAGRPVVREVGLPSDQQDRPVRARLAQPPRAVARRQPAADQRIVDVPVRHHAPGLAPRGELRRDLRLEPRIEDQQHLVARLDHRVGLRHEAGPAAQHGDDQRAVGQRDVLDPAPGGVRALPDLELDDLQVLLLEREQLHEAVLGDLVLDQAEDQVGRRHRGLDVEQLEVLEVARVVDAGDDPLDAVLLLGHLADQDVVLVVAGDRDHQVGALDARALEHPQLGRVAVLDGVLELLLDDAVARVVGLDQRHLAVLGDQLAREVPPDLAGAGDDHVHAVPPPFIRAPRATPDRSRPASGRSSTGPARRTRPRGRGRRPGPPRAGP